MPQNDDVGSERNEDQHLQPIRTLSFLEDVVCSPEAVCVLNDSARTILPQTDSRVSLVLECTLLQGRQMGDSGDRHRQWTGGSSVTHSDDTLDRDTRI